MTDSSPTRIYPDTNILVSYSLGNSDENFELAERLFEEVQNNKYKMVVSNFTLMETLHALRTIVARMKYQELDNSPSQGDLIQVANSKTFEETVYKESMKAFSTIIDKITRDPAHFSFEPDGLTYPNETFASGLQLLLATKGSFRVYSARAKVNTSFRVSNHAICLEFKRGPRHIPNPKIRPSLCLFSTFN